MLSIVLNLGRTANNSHAFIFKLSSLGVNHLYGHRLRRDWGGCGRWTRNALSPWHRTGCEARRKYLAGAEARTRSRYSVTMWWAISAGHSATVEADIVFQLSGGVSPFETILSTVMIAVVALTNGR